MRATLHRLYEQVEHLLAPGLRHSQYMYEQALESVLKPGSNWLDLGCGHQVLPSWRAGAERPLVARSRQLVGLDYDLVALRNHRSIKHRVRGNITSLPFRSGHFDLVTANMVLEHLAEPSRQLGEVRRILVAGGLFLIHTPNSTSYTTLLARLPPQAIKNWLARLLEGRAESDIFPTHYRANTRGRIHELASTAGLEVVDVKMVVSTATTAVILPLAVLELLWLRLLMTRPFKGIRTNMIVTLRRPRGVGEGGGVAA